MGYRIDATNSVATGNEAETLYMVTSGKHVNGGECAQGSARVRARVRARARVRRCTVQAHASERVRAPRPSLCACA
jgi:hypothetical protein